MAKIILEFDEVEEKENAMTALNAWKYRIALQELDNDMRAVTKYGKSPLKHDKQAGRNEVKFAEYVRSFIRNALDDAEL